jgi:hypothetical protein
MQDVHVTLNPGFTWQKQHSTGGRLFFTSKLELNLGNKLVKCCIWRTALYGAETWTLWTVDQKYLESSEMWCCRKMEISWTDHVRNEEVLHRVERNIIHTVKRRKAIWIGHILCRNCLFRHIITGKIERG